MNSSGCEPTDLTVNWTSPSVDSVNYTNALPWLISRFKPFFYLSDPREESFETVDQVPDYQTEVCPSNLQLLNQINFYNVQIFPFYASFILLEWLILWLKGKSLPPMGDNGATVTIAIYFQATRYDDTLLLTLSTLSLAKYALKLLNSIQTFEQRLRTLTLLLRLRQLSDR
jgi:hypothetical protein